MPKIHGGNATIVHIKEQYYHGTKHKNTEILCTKWYSIIMVNA